MSPVGRRSDPERGLVALSSSAWENMEYIDSEILEVGREEEAPMTVLWVAFGAHQTHRTGRIERGHFG